jgi:DNA-binding beta-propeller fold protein YncE
VNLVRRSATLLSGALLSASAMACAPAVGAPGSPGTAVRHEAWVTSEAVDQIARVRFDGSTLEVVETRTVGSIPTEVDGPHGIAVSPDGRHLYVSLGHGLPNGTLVKLDATTGRVEGRATLGLFPATVALTPDGEYAFVSNFNLHGDHVRSTISMVHLPTMVEVARTPTCVMPHGSRVNAAGTRHYSVCMMDELLVEIDAWTGEVTRRFSVRRGGEGAVAEGATGHSPAAEAGCSPTWAEPSANGAFVYVTCNRAREVLEIATSDWAITRRLPTGENPYNLAATPDGRYLLVTLRSRTDAALEIVDLETGRQVGRAAASTSLAHGVVVTPDSRYAFVSVEGIGSEPGRVDVIELPAGRRVASTTVGQQATGIALVPPAR